jgi:hypothetical protein
MRGDHFAYLRTGLMMVAAGNDGAIRPSLDSVEGDLRCLSDDGDTSYKGGGPTRSSWDGRLGTGGITSVTVR